MIRSLLLVVSALVLAACPAMAKTYYVGKCHAGGFLSISEAIKSVAAGSVIDICPGTYSEEVIISKSLTLQGIASQNTNVVTIIGTSGSTAESVLGLELLPSIWVTGGTVNLSNLAVDSNFINASGCAQLPTGIFYASGTSGTINHVVISAFGKNCGAGILAENNTINASSIKIENSYIDSDNFGILMGSLQPEGTNPVLLNTITGNTVGAPHGMYLLQSRGKISANNITYNEASGPSYGILDASPATTITENTISVAGVGITIAAASGVVTANKISADIGIDVGCTAATVTGNTILATGGLDNVPATFTGKNIFLSAKSLIYSNC